MQPVIMSDRNQSLLFAPPKVFSIKNHSYYLRHVRHDFITYSEKLGIRCQASKDMLKEKEMFNRVAYAHTRIEYVVAMEELRK